ncbi:hypothetical protein FPG101_03130 [Flavobacterium psychrophilum FPG101]|nr:hypothetical protein FPG101_03130 [Flavobacterium psychrophilum FPG101]
MVQRYRIFLVISKLFVKKNCFFFLITKNKKPKLFIIKYLALYINLFFFLKEKKASNRTMLHPQSDNLLLQNKIPAIINKYTYLSI